MDYIKTFFLLAITGLASCASPDSKKDTNITNGQEIEIYAELPQAVGNIAYTLDDELVFSHHPFYNPEIRVAILNADRKSYTPFPNLDWNTPKDDTEDFLDTVLGVRSDKDGIVWMLDMGNRSGITPKLVGWNTLTDTLERIYYIPSPASIPESQHNDFVIDKKNGYFYIADEGIGPGGNGSRAALVVVNIQTGEARRILEGHRTTIPENIAITVDNQSWHLDGPDSPFLLVGADGITLDKDGEWLYYAPLNGRSIYRIPVKHLIDGSLSDADLDIYIERYSDKPNTGGFSIDKAGNIYFTEVDNRNVGVVWHDTRKYEPFAFHPDLNWPDGVSFSNDGYMYVSAAKLFGVEKKEPYFIFRFKPVTEGIFGH